MIDDHHAAAIRLGPGLALHWPDAAADLIELPDGSPWEAIESVRACGGTMGLDAVSYHHDRGPIGAVVITVSALRIRSSYITENGPEAIFGIISPIPLTLAQLIRAGSN